MSASNRNVQRARPIGGLPQRQAISFAAATPSHIRCRGGIWLGGRAKAAANPCSTKRWRRLATVWRWQLKAVAALDAHLKADHDIASFPTAAGYTNLPSVLQDKPQLSRRTQDTPTFGLTDFPEAIALRVATQLQLPPPPFNPFANLKALEEAAQRGWLLSSSQLAPLLGLKTLTGQTIHRYGFTCTRQGRNGVESAWKITKAATS